MQQLPRREQNIHYERKSHAVKYVFSAFLLFWATTTTLLLLRDRSYHATERTQEFVTFAFTANAGGRWNTTSCRRALRLTYSSLVKSQVEYPKLHVYTNEALIIPTHTTAGDVVDISVHLTSPLALPKNAYSAISPWKSLSRAKLYVVERLLKSRKNLTLVWIDLDTVVFMDLRIPGVSAWVIGYQNGGCGGAKNCSWEHVARGGSSIHDIDARNDALGDLWSLDLEAIEAVKQYEAEHLKKKLPLPEYDLQGLFTLMLQDRVLPAVFLHDVTDRNFGFVCSNFKHPSKLNIEWSIKDGKLLCPKRDSIHMSERVGAISFTAITIRQLLLDAELPKFEWIRDVQVRDWLIDWFYTTKGNTNLRGRLELSRTDA